MSATLPQPAPRRGRRTPAPIRRVLFAAAALLALFLVLMTAYGALDMVARETTTERATYQGVRSLVLDDPSDVRLTGAPAGAPLEVVARVTEGLRRPSRSVEQTDRGELRLSSSCPAFFGGSCGVDYTIRVPSGTVVRAEISAGDVELDRLTTTAPLSLRTSAGDVTANEVTAPSIELVSSAGDIEARALSAEQVELRSSAGDVVASLAEPARAFTAESSAGDVELLVPDAVYKVDSSSSAGEVDTDDLRTDPRARRSIRVRTSAGDIRVAVRP